jgi:hypothetical protein
MLLLLGFGFLAHMMWGHSTHTFTTGIGLVYLMLLLNLWLLTFSLCSSLFQFVPICSNLFQFVPICSNLFQFVPVYGSITSLFRFWIDDFPYSNLFDTNPDTYYAFFLPFALLLTLIVQNIFVAIIINAFSMIHAESKQEHWKHDLPGLTFEARKRCGLGYLHCRLRCRGCVWWHSCRHVCCCCARHCSCEISRDLGQSKWALDDLLDKNNNYQIAKDLLGQSAFHRHLVWAREFEFYHIMAISARHCRRTTMSGGTIPSLYEYFRRAYQEHPTDEACYMR